MRRVFCLIFVVVILCVCALPAFALGEDYGAPRYNGIPFDSLVISGYGGPIEYFGAESRIGTELNGSIYGFPNDRLLTYSTICSAQLLSCGYNFDFVPASGATSTTQVSFVMNQKYAVINEGGLQFYFSGYNSNFTVTSIEITGAYYTIYSSSGKPQTGFVNFGKTFSTNLTGTKTFDITPYILEAIDYKPAGNGVFFRNLTVNFRVRRDSGDSDLSVTTVATPQGTYTQPVAFSNWLNPALSSFDYTNSSNHDFDVGTILGNSVAGFLAVPIWGEFSFGHLLGIAITLGVLFFALKLLV